MIEIVRNRTAAIAMRIHEPFVLSISGRFDEMQSWFRTRRALASSLAVSLVRGPATVIVSIKWALAQLNSRVINRWRRIQYSTPCCPGRRSPLTFCTPARSPELDGYM